MELKKRLDFRMVLVSLYFVALFIYILVGLQPAGAKNYNVSAHLFIPSISLSTDVTTLKLVNHTLETPDYIVGSYTKHENKTLLIGHSSTVFKDLDEAKLDAVISYDNLEYIIKDIKTLEKSDIKMSQLLKNTEKKTLVLMTCAGDDLGNGDATHRLIITAEAG